ncbi:hypothetical protein A6U94_15275 [Agrobacterium tumefaciens]|nr:hypothetical protein A6U94_15275 [Agrobacterium tumefaciens]
MSSSSETLEKKPVAQPQVHRATADRRQKDTRRRRWKSAAFGNLETSLLSWISLLPAPHAGNMILVRGRRQRVFGGQNHHA